MGLSYGSKFTSLGEQLEPEPECSTQSPTGDLGIPWSYLIVSVVVEAVAGRGINAVGVIKQKARIADAARLTENFAVRLGALAGCRAGARFIVGICRAAC